MMPMPDIILAGLQRCREAITDQLRYRDLLAALGALVTNWQQREQQYRNLRPHDGATPDTLRSCATELAAELAKHREP